MPDTSLAVIERPAEDWKLQIFAVHSAAQQRRIVARLRSDRPDIVVTGARDGTEWFVVMESPTDDVARRSRSTVTTIDPHASRVYELDARRAPRRVPPLLADWMI
jgi:hypothetical protein